MTEDRGDGLPRPPSTEGDGATKAAETTAPKDASQSPPIDISVGNRPDAEVPRSGLVVAFAISLAVSAVLHAVVIGADLVRLPSPAHPDEAAVPVTVVEDPQPKEQPEPKTDAATPKEEAKPPEPQTTAQKKEEEPEPPPPALSTPEPTPPKEAENPPPSSPAPDEAEQEPGNPAAAVLDDKSAHDAVAALRAQIEKCWTIPAGWTNPHQVTVVINLRLERSGALSGRPVPVEFSASQLGMEAAKNAVEAATKCAPYRLPPDQYDKWHEAQVRLAPH